MDPSSVKQNVQKAVQNYVSLHPGVKDIPVGQLTGAVRKGVKPTELTKEEGEALAGFRAEIAEYEPEYESWKADILDVQEQQSDAWPPGRQYLMNRAEGFLPEMDKLFGQLAELADRARTSRSSLHKLERSLAWYRKNPSGHALVKTTHAEICEIGRNLERLLLQEERNDLGQIKQADEAFFRWYLQEGKAPVKLYRGDGRNVNAQTLDNFAFTDIKAGGTPDISFYGVVQHTHTSSAKNGMVSTTTDRDQAMAWALDGKNYGLLFEIETSNYIHVADLLARRNFKDRFPAQLEYLIPGDLSAADIMSVTLYHEPDRVNIVKRIAQ